LAATGASAPRLILAAFLAVALVCAYLVGARFPRSHTVVCNEGGEEIAVEDRVGRRSVSPGLCEEIRMPTLFDAREAAVAGQAVAPCGYPDFFGHFEQILVLRGGSTTCAWVE
jgi:hypothetical protein